MSTTTAPAPAPATAPTLSVNLTKAIVSLKVIETTYQTNKSSKLADIRKMVESEMKANGIDKKKMSYLLMDAGMDGPLASRMVNFADPRTEEIKEQLIKATEYNSNAEKGAPKLTFNDEAKLLTGKTTVEEIIANKAAARTGKARPQGNKPTPTPVAVTPVVKWTEEDVLAKLRIQQMLATTSGVPYEEWSEWAANAIQTLDEENEEENEEDNDADEE